MKKFFNEKLQDFETEIAIAIGWIFSMGALAGAVAILVIAMMQ